MSLNISYTYPTGSERSIEITDRRNDLLLAALEHLTESFRSRRNGLAVSTSKVDGAAMALADALRKPETCFTCGQEVHQ